MARLGKERTRGGYSYFPSCHLFRPADEGIIRGYGEKMSDGAEAEEALLPRLFPPSPPVDAPPAPLPPVLSRRS